MLGKKIINTGGGVACTTNTTQILDGGTTQSTALYRFEDNANDTASSTGKFNKGGVFNGTNSAIDLPTGDLGIGTNDFSVSFWFNCADITQNDQSLFWFQHYQSPIRIGAALSQSAYGGDGDVRFYCTISGTGTNANSNSDIFSSNTWYHIVFVKSSTSGMAVYVNGSSTPVATNTGATGAVNNNISSNGKNTIGAYTSSTAHLLFFNGKIDQFRTFNKALSTSEIATLYNETTTTVNTLQVLGDYSCISTYTFEGNANDLNTSTPKNGTATNVIYDYSGTASNVTYAAGKFDKAAVFNGSNGYITTGLTLPANSTMSFSFWFNKSASQVASGDVYILSDMNSSASHRRIDIRYNTGTDVIFIDIGNGSSSSQTNTGYTPPSDTWTHLAVTLNGTAVKMYINGNSTPVADYTSSVAFGTAGADALVLGRPGAYNCCYFTGKLDQFRIFDKTLSSGEINSLYNETTTTAALATIINPSTIAYYKMADATDETGSYNGTASNVDFNVEGKYGFAGKFNGSNSYIDISTLDFPTNNFSVSAWVYLNSTPGSTTYNMILTTAKQNSGGYFYFTFYGTQLQYYHVASGTSVIGGTVVAGQWNHVVLTQSSTGGAKVYLNTSVAASNTGLTANNTPNTTSGGVNTLGFYNTGSSTTGSLNGRMDQVRIFNKAISAAEVTKLYDEVQCANTIDNPESYFNTKLYTGNRPSSQSITGVGFQPDLVWVKVRSAGGYGAVLADSVSGAQKFLDSSNANVQTSSATSLVSFDTDGFSVGGYGNWNGGLANANSTMVSWNWKAAASNTTNNDGTIASTVRASQESGFSIVQHTAPASGYYTVGHGLNKKPSLVITKSATTSGYNWYTWASVLSDEAKSYLALDLTMGDGVGNNYNMWAASGSGFTSTTFGHRVGYSAGANSTQIAYCFANVDGYQRIGSYVGNGSANGPFVYTGFEPAWLLVKEINVNGAYWIIIDNKRNTSNPRKKNLFANATDAEMNYGEFDFFSNGFQPSNNNSDTNGSGDTYLFMAIAANPDTTAPTKANSFKTVLYNGTGASQTITGAGFKPDLAWIKSRSNATSHEWHDSVRGEPSRISSNLEQAEATSLNGFVSLASDGFTVDGAGGGGEVNTNSRTYVAWLWKALDHDRNLAAINTNGTIPAMVSANPAAGFSILQWVSDGSSSISTKGHGLGSAPEMFIVFSRTHGSIWQVYHKDLALNQYISLNNDSGLSGVGATYYSSTANTIGFRDGSNSNSGQNMIAYCWHSVSGYSKIGSYSGSGASGKSVTTGFQPSFVLIKNSTSQAWWNLSDSARGASKSLFPNDSYQEVDDTGGQRAKTFNSTGFTLDGNNNDINGSGQTYIYMAIK